MRPSAESCESTTVSTRKGKSGSSSRRKDTTEAKFDFSSEQLREQFNTISRKIYTILAKQRAIKELHPPATESLSLNPGCTAHYRVYSKEQQGPFKITGTVESGNGILLLSQRIERPTREHHGKSYALGAKDLYIAYLGDKGKGRVFAEEYIYLAIEATSELAFTFKCGFHQGKPSLFFFFSRTQSAQR
jgi:hypothetical protein